MEDFLEFAGFITSGIVVFFAIGSLVVFLNSYTLDHSMWGCSKLEKGLCAEYSRTPIKN